MRQKSTTTKDSALAGVSALIVFIALVLVAAIAAGVIIDTAGFLQERAQTTGESSSDQISTTLNTLSVVGEIEALDETGSDDLYTDAGTPANADDYRITEVRVTVLASPGSPEINLNDTTVQVVQPSGSIQLLTPQDESVDSDLFIRNTSGPGDLVAFGADSRPGTDLDADSNREDAARFGVDQVQGEDFPLIQDPEDRYELIIPFDGDVDAGGAAQATYELSALGEGQIIQLRFVTGPGGDTIERFRTPSTLPENDGETIIL